MQPSGGRVRSLPPLVFRKMSSLVLGIMIGGMLAQPGVWAAELSFCPLTGAGRMHASVESLLERRWKHVVKQGLDISCGSAALATILNYQYGNVVSESRIIEAILTHVNPEEVKKRGGFSLLDLKRVTATLGYTVKGYKLSLQQLKELSTPALTPITLRGFKHFVVFRGAVGDRVVLADPAFGNLLVPEDRFRKIWQGLAMVVVKDGAADNGPSQLDVADDDLPIADRADTLRNFIQRINVQSVIGFNEF